MKKILVHLFFLFRSSFILIKTIFKNWTTKFDYEFVVKNWKLLVFEHMIHIRVCAIIWRSKWKIKITGLRMKINFGFIEKKIQLLSIVVWLKIVFFFILFQFLMFQIWILKYILRFWMNFYSEFQNM